MHTSKTPALLESSDKRQNSPYIIKLKSQRSLYKKQSHAVPSNSNHHAGSTHNFEAENYEDLQEEYERANESSKPQRAYSKASLTCNS